MVYKNSISNRRIILPLKDNIVNTWPEDCFLLSIIHNKESAYDWIMNFLIQTVAVIGDNGEGRITFYPNGAHHKKTNLFDMCPFINKYVIPRELILDSYNTFSDFLIYALDNHLYISNILDQHFRLPNKEKNIFFHPNYFYGYDLNKKVFHVLDNFNFGKYTSIEVDFGLINESYSLLDNFTWSKYDASTYLYEVKDYNFKFSQDILVNYLNDYLLSNNNLGYLDKFIRPQDKNICYGVNCYSLLCNALNEVLNKTSEDTLDLRSFVFLIDHKILMKLRIAYLMHKRYIIRNESLINNIENLEHDCRIVLNLIIKYNITKDTNIIYKVLKYIEDIKKNDQKIVEILLHDLYKAVK